MRMARIKEAAGGYYHVMSRVVDRRMVLDDKEKERFRQLMRRTALFSGVEVLTYALLDNHFHILVHVPQREELDDKQFMSRLKALYSSRAAHDIASELSRLRAEQQHIEAERLKAQYLARMYDLSEFMKTVKQRFSQSFNRRHGRKGTLWEERFKSVLIEGSQGVLSTVAAYIDLNAVRAGIVDDPRHYRFCGYGEAMGGSRSARRGLQAVMTSLGNKAAWEELRSSYRQLLYVSGQAKGLSSTGAATKPGFSQEQVERVLEKGGKITFQQALHCRVRYFSDGLILGSRSYVDEAFHRYRDRFGLKRRSGARRMRGADWPELFTARRLQLAPISVSARLS